MPDLTTRFGLQKPRGGSSGSSPAEAVDIDVLNGNFDIIDRLLGAPRTTSGSYPSSPAAGQLVYLTDLMTFAVYSGSSWQVYNPFNYTGANTTGVITISGNYTMDSDSYIKRQGNVVTLHLIANRTAGPLGTAPANQVVATITPSFRPTVPNSPLCFNAPLTTGGAAGVGEIRVDGTGNIFVAGYFSNNVASTFNLTATWSVA